MSECPLCYAPAMPERIRSLLVANRGEIAIRVMRAATELGIRTVAIYSQEDRFSLHRMKADESYLVGAGRTPVDAYLDIADIVRIAQAAQVDAIHPGYGFLSENPAFAEACAAAGMIFVGPTPQIMRRLGNKVSARELAVSAGVPVMPATPPLPHDDAAAARLAAEVGYPVMLKASWGGGGRGMRVVDSEAELAEKVATARREAKAAFGNDEVYLEKLVRRARHIEVQLLGDSHGNLVHLFERDCTVQRRNQKVVERAPAAFFDEQQRRELCEQALKIGRAVQYLNAGTVEFLQDADTRQVLLHRSQSAHPGRAHGDRGRHRHRHRASADPHRRGRGDRHAGERRAAPGGHPPQRLRDAVPGHDRGPGEQFHPRLRPDHRVPQSGRLRHPARRRHRVLGRDHHAFLRLAAGEGDGLGADAAGHDRAHAPRAVGVPRPRRQDQPALPRSADHASALRGRGLHDEVHRRDAGAVPLPAQARPRDAAAELHRRRDRQRQPRGEGAGRARRGWRIRSCRSSTCRRRRPARSRSSTSSAPSASPLDAASRSACC